MQCEQAQVNHNKVLGSAKGSGTSPRAISSLTSAETIAAEVDVKVNKIFAEADVNNDGAISHAEFLWVMTGLDFHLLEKLGVPVEGGYSAKETFLYNSKINTSYDSAVEDWDRDIDQHFDEEMCFSNPYNLAINAGSSVNSVTSAGSPIKGQMSFQNLGRNQSSSNSTLGTGGASANGLASREGSAKNRRLVVARPINSPPPSARKESAAHLETHIEQPVGVSSNSGGASDEVPAERPQQRQSRRLRDTPVMERVDTPPSYKGILAKNAVDRDFHEELQVMLHVFLQA